MRLKDLVRAGITRTGFEVTRVGRGTRGAPSYSRFEDVIQGHLKSLGDPVHVAVDIAAADGKSASNTYALFKRGWSGLAVEAAPSVFARLGLNYRDVPRVSLHRGWITPHNAAALLEAADIPKTFGFLSLDIDGFDHDVLEALLSSYRPSLVCAEHNANFPPPILFNLPFSPDYVRNDDGCSGQSVSMLDALASRHGYALIGLEYENAFLAPVEFKLQAVTPEEAYRAGYADKIDRRSRFPWTAEFEPLQTMPPTEAVKWIHDRYAHRRGEFFCAVSQREG